MNEWSVISTIHINTEPVIWPPSFRNIDTERDLLSFCVPEAYWRSMWLRRINSAKRFEREQPLCKLKNLKAYPSGLINEPLKSCILFDYKQEVIPLILKNSSDISRSWEAMQRLFSTGIWLWMFPWETSPWAQGDAHFWFFFKLPQRNPKSGDLTSPVLK